MSINFIICDDEYFIRQRIKKIIPLEIFQLNLVGEAENGLEVIELLNQYHVDIILLDIKMPKMNGLELTKYVHENFPDTKIIILSGYNDFEYARLTMKYNVTDYLLKPVEKDILCDTVSENIKKVLSSRNQIIQKEQYYHYEKCTLLSSIITNKDNLSKLLIQYPEIRKNKCSLYIGVFIFEETNYWINNLIHSLRLSCYECEYIKESDYIYVLQLFFNKKEDITSIYHTLEKIIFSCIPYIFLTISGIFLIEDNWEFYYKKVLFLLNYRYFYKQPSLYDSPTVESINFSTNDLINIRKEILYLLNSNIFPSFQAYIENLFYNIELKKNVNYLYLVISEIFMTYNIHYHNTMCSVQNPIELASLLIEEDYKLHSIQESVISYGLECMHERISSPSDVSLSKKIITYIHENYTDPDLSVNQLSQVFGLNMSYMGSIFKKIYNQSILQYITTKRLEESKKLLATNLYKVSDIATMVGYSDVFYYSKRFKKMYGCSPKDYMLTN